MKYKTEFVILSVVFAIVGLIGVGISGHYLDWSLASINFFSAIAIGIFGYMIGRTAE